MRLIYRTIPKSTLVKLYTKQGLSLRAIARKYGCDTGVISRALKSHKIPVRHPARAHSFSKEELTKLYIVDGLSTYAIAAEYNCDPKTVYRYLKLHNIQSRPRKRISLTEAVLRLLYVREKLSLKDIADKHGYSAAGVLKKLREYEIERRSISETSTKHPKYDFDGSATEKAYVIGFRLGDLGIRSRGNLVYVSSSTTKEPQVKLIHDLFSAYGPVWIGNEGKSGARNISASLNQSFAFLVPKHTAIPRWILASRTCFFSFLAGYTDAEGNFQIAGGTARFRIRSYDVGILENLHRGLIRYGIHNTFRLESIAGTNAWGVKHNRDCWCLAVASALPLRKLLGTLLPLLRHEKRRADAEVAMNNVVLRTA
jgi:DNA-binding CsgD family transcriptional regulator